MCKLIAKWSMIHSQVVLFHSSINRSKSTYRSRQSSLESTGDAMTVLFTRIVSGFLSSETEWRNIKYVMVGNPSISTLLTWRVIAIVIYTTKIGEFVCPPNISETVAVRIMKLAHPPRIASTTIKLISKPILLAILSILLKTIKRIGTGPKRKSSPPFVYLR